MNTTGFIRIPCLLLLLARAVVLVFGYIEHLELEIESPSPLCFRYLPSVPLIDFRQPDVFVAWQPGIVPKISVHLRLPHSLL